MTQSQITFPAFIELEDGTYKPIETATVEEIRDYMNRGDTTNEIAKGLRRYLRLVRT